MFNISTSDQLIVDPAMAAAAYHAAATRCVSVEETYVRLVAKVAESTDWSIPIWRHANDVADVLATTAQVHHPSVSDTTYW